MVRGLLLFLAGFVSAFVLMDRFAPPDPDTDPYLGDAQYYDGVLHNAVEPNNLN